MVGCWLGNALFSFSAICLAIRCFVELPAPVTFTRLGELFFFDEKKSSSGRVSTFGNAVKRSFFFCRLEVEALKVEEAAFDFSVRLVRFTGGLRREGPASALTNPGTAEDSEKVTLLEGACEAGFCEWDRARCDNAFLARVGL